MAIACLIVGLATDGPDDTILKLNTDRDLVRTYGGNYIDRQTITAAATSLSLDFEPWVLPQNRVNSIRNYLYAPASSGTLLVFGNIGGSGSHTVDLIYDPYLGQSDLLYAARRYLETTGRSPYTLRLAGAYARLNYGGWAVTARYSGSKYNNVTFTLNSTGLQVGGLEPTYPILKYTFTTSGTWAGQFERDSALGLSPIRVEAIGSYLGSLTTALTGGTNGSFTTAALTTLFDGWSPPIDVTHVLILTPATSALVDLIYQDMQNGTSQPRLYLLPAPTYSSPASSYLSAIQTTLPERLNMISLVIGDITSNVKGVLNVRYSAEEVLTGLVRRAGFNLTNTPVLAEDFTPVLTETELNSCIANGVIPLMRYIGNDVAVYQGCVSSADVSYLYSAKIAEIFSLARKYFAPFLGQPMTQGEHPELATELSNILQAITFMQVDRVDVGVDLDAVLVAVQATLPTEVLAISFTIKNKPGA